MSYAALNKYKQNSVTTATPEELTLMLYDGAIKFMNIAKFSIEKKQMEKAHNSLVRAQDIINELNYSLDMKYEISEEMRKLYDFVISKLVDGNMQKDIKPIEDAIAITSDMRDTWKEVMKLVKQKVYKTK
jgi:flagellar secretion chaperone FliS